MEFETAVQTCRNVRDFAQVDICDVVLSRILEVARTASSAYNMQPWRFVVVRSAETKAKLADLCKGQTFVSAASAVVVCCGKKYANPYNWVGENLYLLDMAIAIDHLRMAARNEGVGSCWIAVFEHEPVKALLGVPEDHDVVMLVPLGYPIGDQAFHTTTERLPLDQIVFDGTFGKKWTAAPRWNKSRHWAGNPLDLRVPTPG